MIVRKVVFNNRCSCCGRLLLKRWQEDKDQVKEAFIKACWRTYDGHDYCRDCWKREDDGTVTTRDGLRFDENGMLVGGCLFFTGISESMTLTQIQTEIAKASALADQMVGRLYRGILQGELDKARYLLDKLLSKRKGTWEYDCYVLFKSRNIFSHIYGDAVVRSYI